MDHVLLLDMAIHTFDAARYITGADPVSVYAEEFRTPWSWYRGADSAIANFQMSDGSRYQYRGSWSTDGCHTSWEGNWRASGAEGTAIWDGSNDAYADIITKRGGFFSEVERREANKHDVGDGIKGSLDEFLNALASGETPNGECHDNIKSLAMVFGAIESSKRGERVLIEEMLA